MHQCSPPTTTTHTLPLLMNGSCASSPSPLMNNNNNNNVLVALPVPVFLANNSNRGFVETTGDAGRDASGIKSLRKVDKPQLDRPSVSLQEARGETVTTSTTGSW